MNKNLKNTDVKKMIILLIVLILLPGLVKGMFYVGHEVGLALASIF